MGLLSPGFVRIRFIIKGMASHEIWDGDGILGLSMEFT